VWAQVAPFPQEGAYTQPLYMVDLQIDTKAAPDDQLDIGILNVVEQIEQ
jgi:hypothetical protein